MAGKNKQSKGAPEVELALLAEARSEVAHADGKASFVLAGLSIGFSALLAGVLAGDWHPSNLSQLGELAWWLGSALALTSLGVSASAIWPRLGHLDLNLPIFYWGQIAKLASRSELDARLDKKPPNETERTRDQLWTLSNLVFRKYWLIRIALLAGASAVLLFLVAALTEL